MSVRALVASCYTNGQLAINPQIYVNALRPVRTANRGALSYPPASRRRCEVMAEVSTDGLEDDVAVRSPVVDQPARVHAARL